MPIDIKRWQTSVQLIVRQKNAKAMSEAHRTSVEDIITFIPRGRTFKHSKVPASAIKCSMNLIAISLNRRFVIQYLTFFTKGKQPNRLKTPQSNNSCDVFIELFISMHFAVASFSKLSKTPVNQFSYALSFGKACHIFH